MQKHGVKTLNRDRDSYRNRTSISSPEIREILRPVSSRSLFVSTGNLTCCWHALLWLPTCSCGSTWDVHCRRPV